MWLNEQGKRSFSIFILFKFISFIQFHMVNVIRIFAYAQDMDER